MKLHFVLFLILILSVFDIKTGNCQLLNYFVDGSRWVYETNESTEPNYQFITHSTEQFEIQGDTLVNFIRYKKLFNKKIIEIIPNPNTCIQCNVSLFYDSSLQYIRFDSTSNEVYYRSDTSISDILVYSFSPAKWDTLTGIYSGSNYIVDSIQPINLFGVQTSKYYISQTPPWNFIEDKNYLIDGIGSSNGLLVFQPVEIVVSGGIFMTQLVCFQLMDSIFLGFNRIQCPYVNFPTSIPEFKENIRTMIYPNPFSNNLNIYLSKFMEYGQIDIFNSMGIKVYTNRFMGNSKSINYYLASGMYFIQILGSDFYYTQKIFRE